MSQIMVEPAVGIIQKAELKIARLLSGTGVVLPDFLAMDGEEIRSLELALRQACGQLDVIGIQKRQNPGLNVMPHDPEQDELNFGEGEEAAP